MLLIWDLEVQDMNLDSISLPGLLMDFVSSNIQKISVRCKDSIWIKGIKTEFTQVLCIKVDICQ